MTDYPMGFVDIGAVAMLTNPDSGHGRARHSTERAMATFRNAGVEVLAFQGRTTEDSRRLTREAVESGRFDAIVVCGGDGMINVVLQETAGKQIPVGVIPAGTGNDHAREHDLPRTSPEAAAEVIAAGFTVTTDLGRITDRTGAVRWFGTVMTAGFDSLVSDRANRMTWPHGSARYNLSIAAELINLRPLSFSMTLHGRHAVPGEPGPVDGSPLELRGSAMLAAFGNTRTYGGGLPVCPFANHRDGLLEVTLVDPVNRVRFVSCMARILKGTHVELPEVHSFRVRSARVWVHGVDAYADGERMADLPVTVEAVPAAGKFIVPAP
ncbi:diacylglycerol kinase [Corynebacterium sp. P6145]|uniref:diacylglycerol kinase n=1 Tax=Corynebacterium antarcticum TaxID=2800405 RepID=UPI00200476FD|nr:diacylglycerol kinase [Corynebacterium antarcticum]MCK7642001.1 diacylglycerol kinase [Corynebacterium antarcticum]MCX7492937.1 diacylglycerol kinase [Corynebacterium antarcticum]